MVDFRHPAVRPFALGFNFGLERESLRVTDGGRMAHTPHPFPDSGRIVRDFCENQTEINTGVHPSAAGAVAELSALDRAILERISRPDGGAREWLWPFSNPPPLAGEDDVVPARFTGKLSAKTEYRDYLSVKYGGRKMAFCGIHVNFSFSDALVAAAAEVRVPGSTSSPEALRRYRDALYLHVAAGSVLWGWIVVALTAASPVADASLFGFCPGGSDVFPGFSSIRCGDLGYWNHFTPVNDFSGVEAFAGGIRKYVAGGLIAAPSELYYPIRLKPRGQNRLETLASGGIDHIEIRCVDLNPFVHGLVDERDVEFIGLFLLWCAGRPPARLTARDQVQAVRNFKNAAMFDIDLAGILLPDGSSGSVRSTGLRLIASMEKAFAGFPARVAETLAFERGKLESPETRYAVAVRDAFSGPFAEKGLAFAKKTALDILASAGADGGAGKGGR